MGQIKILVDEGEQGGAPGMPMAPGATLSGGSSMLKRVAVDTEVLTSSVRDMTETLSSTFNEARSVTGATLDEATVSLEISAEGGVSLIGSAKAGIKGAIELKFKFS